MLRDAALLFSLAALLLNFGTHLLARSFFARHAKKIFWINACAVLAFSGIMTELQYAAWQGNVITMRLLPPFEPWTYFAQYVLFRVWVPFLISFALGWLVASVSLRMNTRAGNVFFYEDEPWIAGAALLLVGYPAVLVFCVLFILVFTVSSAVQTARKGKAHRISPYFMWLPVALCVILIAYFFCKDMAWWMLLRP